MGIINYAQDIFPAVSGSPVENGSLHVYPGSPVSQKVGMLAANTGMGTLSYGNGLFESYGVYNTIAKTYPQITGNAVIGLGQAGNIMSNIGISGQYHVATEPRNNAIRYYTIGASGSPGQYGNPVSISGTYNA